MKRCARHDAACRDMRPKYKPITAEKSAGRTYGRTYAAIEAQAQERTMTTNTFAKRLAETEITAPKAEAIFKRCIDRRAAANAALDAYVSVVAAERKITKARATDVLVASGDKQYAALYAAHSDAHDPVGTTTKTLAQPRLDVLTAERDAVQKQLRDTVESYALQHDMDLHAAEARLEKSSSQYKELFSKSYDLETQRYTALQQARTHSEAVLLAHNGQRVDDAQKRATAAAHAKERPSQAALREYTEALAKSRGVSFTKAQAEALASDPVAQKLYDLIAAEDAQRRMAS